jgi:chaperone protein DnaK
MKKINTQLFSKNISSKYRLQPIKSEKTVGIDLGTTNSAVAFMEGGKPAIVPNAEGGRTTPSVVAFNKHGDRLVGQIAKRQAMVNPINTFFSIKRFIGRKMSEVTEELKQVPYEVSQDEKGNIKLSSANANKKFAPEEISAMVLGKLVEDSQKFMGSSIKKAVITVPAYFNDSQRQATKDAGAISGLEVLRIINEPTAASLAYGFDKKANETILVFDLGGGTFDVSILEVGDGVFEVLSTYGDTHLGGDDFDKRVVDWLADTFKKDEGIDLLNDKQALQRLTESAEKAKIELSAATQTQISLPFITATSDGPKHIDVNLTKLEFEKLSTDLLDRCRKPVEQSLTDANLKMSDIQEVILVGGSTRILAIQQIVKQLSGKNPNMTVNPDEVVALGAAVQAGVLSGEVSDIVLLDVTPLSLGVETLGGVTTKLIPRNTTVPTSKSETFSTASDGQTSVEINVLQGERDLVRDNKSLGNFRLDGIPPAPRGSPKIEVKFDIDANCILSVAATDKGSGKKADIKITGASTLASEDVERIVRDAEMFAEEDKIKREAIDAKNQGDALAYQTRKQLSEFGDKIPQDLKDKVTDKLRELEDAIKSEDTDKIKTATDVLQRDVVEIGQAIYRQQDAIYRSNKKTNDNLGHKSKNDEVIDADVESNK